MEMPSRINQRWIEQTRSKLSNLWMSGNLESFEKLSKELEEAEKSMKIRLAFEKWAIKKATLLAKRGCFLNNYTYKDHKPNSVVLTKSDNIGNVMIFTLVDVWPEYVETLKEGGK